MTKLIDSPFWLDPSDPHRMRSAIQGLTQPHVYDTGDLSDRVWEDMVWQRAVHRVAADGISPEQAVDDAIARIKQLQSE
jgi:multiple sugar transport system substrate-binding protein